MPIVNKRTRRIVTGHIEGRAAIVSDGPSPKIFQSAVTPGAGSELLWATGAHARLSQGPIEAVSEETGYIPHVGESRLFIISFAPDSVSLGPDCDPAAAAREIFEHMPELACHFEPENPGMHRTDTIDYAIVLEGEILLELDDGAQVLLKVGDVVVQNGTRHAWRNRTDRPSRVAFVMVAADRDG